MEVIIYSGNKILIQDLSGIISKDVTKLLKPVLREPSVEELKKIHEAVVNTINSRVDTSSGKLED